MKNKTWTIPVEEDASGDAIIQFPEEFLDETGWREGDTLRWIDNKDGSWTLTRIDNVATPEEEEAWRELEQRQKK